MSQMLERYLAELSDIEKPLVISKLVNLCGLTPSEVELLKREWATIEVERRRRIATWLAELAEDNLELDFDEVLRACLADADEQVVIAAIQGLSGCEDRCLIDPLICLLKGDNRESVRAAAAGALAKFTMLAELEKLRPSDATKVETALFTVIENKAEQFEVCRRAIEAISPLSRPEVKRIIREAYESDSSWLRVSALYAMGRNCDPVWLPVILEELGSSDPEMRFEAAGACGELGDPKAVPHLTQLIHDPDADVQLAAIAALGCIGGSEAKQALLECLNEHDERICEAAKGALKELGFGDDPLLFGTEL